MVEFYVLPYHDQSKQRTHLGILGGKQGDIYGNSPPGCNGGTHAQVSVW